jgi:predicted AlkP superfamily phosphohydrolase/phosphomutase
MPLKKKKLIIIGLDAADLQSTREFMDDGDMPRLSSIAETGCFSRLESTIPSQTGPAWTSITTGVNPGTHGIYYFYNFSTSPITIVNATNSSTPRIWDYVGASKGTSVLVNVPITYPAREMSGSMVSGIPPWFIDERSVYPRELLARLKAAGYEIDTPLSRGLEKQPALLASRLVDTEERRVAAFLDLLRTTTPDWSFGMIVMTALDRLQHKVLGRGAKGKEEEENDEAVRRGYKGVDALVGNVIDSFGGDVNFLVVSDHGFNRRPVAFYPNSWLHAQGLLRRKSSMRNRLARMGHDLFDGHLLWVPQGVTKRFQGAATVVHTIDAIDLESSRAFVPGTDGVVVVRSKEDEEKIISGMSQLTDGSGKEICKIYTREQVYKGDRVGAAPELLIVPRDDINIRTDPFSREVVSTSGDFPRANHGPNGIFLAVGPDIKKAPGDLDISLEDIAPTALALLGLRPPGSLEGRVLKEVLVAPPADGSLKIIEAVGGGHGNDYAFSQEEEKLVMDNLKRLGYT